MILTIAAILKPIWTVLGVVLIFLFMVSVHEFGHYIVGKKLGFKINEFAIGFGKALYKKKTKSGEIFSIRLIPLGGYCAFEGDDESSNDPNAFEKKHPFKRILVLIAGATMNVLATLLVVILVFTISGQYYLKVNEILPAPEGSFVTRELSFQENDVILEIGGERVLSQQVVSRQIAKVIAGGKGTVDTLVLRGGEEVFQKVEIRDYLNQVKDENGNIKEEKRVGLGISISTTEVKFPFFQSIGNSFEYCVFTVKELYSSIGSIISGKVGLDQLGGPISVIQMSASAVNSGLRVMLEFIALIGLNLAIFNLLPIPALDGSKVIFCIIEWIRGKPINRNIEAIVHTVGFFLLIGFAIFVDIIKLF